MQRSAAPTYSAADELEWLLSRIALGDQAALRRLYDLTARHLLAVAMRILRRQEVAEEVLQEVYLGVWSHAEGYSASAGRPMTWLIAMVRHRAIDLLRSKAASTVELSSGSAYEVPESVETAEVLGVAIDHQKVGRCFAVLSPVQRQSLALAYYRGLTLSEVATEVQAPLGSVKSWVRRAMLRLRECMEDSPHEMG